MLFATETDGILLNWDAEAGKFVIVVVIAAVAVACRVALAWLTIGLILACENKLYKQ